MHPRLFTFPAFELLGTSWGPFTLHSYGVLLAIAFITGLWIAARHARRAQLDPDRVTDLAVYVLIAGLIGAKISATFASTGTPSLFLHPVEALHGDLGRIVKGDVVLAISYSG